MTERFERLIIVIFGTFILILAAWFHYSYRKIQDDRIEILDYKIQIQQLEIESQKQAKRYEASRKIADDELKKIQEEGHKILVSNVPKDCNSAMEWAKHEARVFH
jgi:hypothetical protein